ncbi:hypothetical protein C8D04_2683 [Simplicispira sp. 125]|nr:hypothetical protein C8D04_2683 [Simplicispira sp. 125]REG18343.1 hypothetical protein C8D01_2993 [Simplicispira sp. 110]
MGKYNFKLVKPRSVELTRAGYGRVAHLPFILDARPGIHRDGSEYLVDLGLGMWNRAHPGTQGSRPAATSIRSYGWWLCNFLEWCEEKTIDPARADYVAHVLDGFQSDLVSGKWGKDGRPLSDKTVNSYVDTATDYLQWMTWKGKRSHFAVPYVTRTAYPGRSHSAGNSRPRTYDVRQGRRRESPGELQMPTDHQVDIWLESVYTLRGQTLGLMCETVLMSAARRQEVACWRNDTLPLDPQKWVIVNPTADLKHQLVSVRLRYGTKGKDSGIDEVHSDKIGPERQIKIPLHFAEKLHAYRTKIRPRLLKKWVGGARGPEAQRERLNRSVHLFLNPEGIRQSASSFYSAWKSGALPYPAWSPHLGRHWWACSTLVKEIRDGREHREPNYTGPGTLTAILMKGVIELKIVPQLGHISSTTTSLYVRWVCNQLDEALPERYQSTMVDWSEDH